MYDLLSEEQVIRLKERRDELKRLLHSYTIWGITDTPLKSEEEIKKIKEDGAAEIVTIIKRLKENTRKKRESTRLKNLELARKKDEELTRLKNQRAQM